MEWESRPDRSFEARAGDLLYRLVPEMGRRGTGWWRLTVYRLVPLSPEPAFSSSLEARTAVRQLADDAEGLGDAEVGELLARLIRS
jgi:hypothetical protein